MTERHFDASLRDLKDQLIAMATLVEHAIDASIEGLQRRDLSKTKVVFEIEREVNLCHKSVDEACVRLLALQQPLAADLRLIVAVTRINTDLERMGDQAVNIALNSEFYLKGAELKPLVDLPTMAEEVRHSVREVIDSFVRTDERLARDVLKRDDVIDGFKNKIFRDVLDHAKMRPELFEQGLALILIARNLERIGDHATNIAEDVIYAVSGEDVRHSGTVGTLKGALKEV